jgi:hypothetical protein
MVNMIDLRKSAKLNGVEPIELYSWFKRFIQSNKRVICYCEECGQERNISYQQYNDLCSLCGNKEYWSHQENRNAESERKIEFFSHQENRNAESERKIEFFSYQENRNATGEQLRQYYIDHPKARKVVSEKTIKQFEDPKQREKRRESQIKIWEDSEFREENGKRISAGKQGIPYDEWEGYASKQLYCPNFNEECKESNREKYGRMCFLTGSPESENKYKNGKRRKLSVHHVDMDKGQGCNGKRWKLVPLCITWHGKVHNGLWESRIIWLLDNVWKDQRVYI